MDRSPILAGKAVCLIEAGAMDDDNEERLAIRLGITTRHLRRVVKQTMGVTPVALAQTRRLLSAKQLLGETNAPITEIAFAAGFASLRRFNAAFLDRYGLNPSTMRRARAAPVGHGITLRLAYRPPYDLDAHYSWLAQRAIPGVEQVEGLVWRRTVQISGRVGVISVTPNRENEVEITLSDSLLPAMRPLLARIRAVFDLDADIARIDAFLGRHSELLPLVRARPGIRLPLAFDPFEGVIRTILGQQVSVGAARTFAGRLAATFGTALPDAPDGLTRIFPTAHALAAAGAGGLQTIGLTQARAQTLFTVAQAIVSEALNLASPNARTQLRALPGIGEWTETYVALRVLGDPDVFPLTDLVLAQRIGGENPQAQKAIAEHWSPWRSYAAQRIWMQGDTKEFGNAHE